MKNRRVFSALTAFVLSIVIFFMPLFSVKVTAAAPDRVSEVPGDVTGDEKVNTKDILAIRQYLGGILEKKDIYVENADLNGNGYPDVKDTLKIRRYLGGVEVSLGPVYTVMTYNVGLWYNGSGNLLPAGKYNEYLQLQKSMIYGASPDILCLQEYCSEITAGKSTKENLLTSDKFPYIETAKCQASINNYMGKAICSRFPIIDVENETLEPDGTYDSPNFEVSHVWLSGRRVCVISAHAAAHPMVALQEMHIILKMLQDEPYFILCADTNIDFFDKGYVQALKDLFELYGVDCNFANGGDHGTFVTYPNRGYAIDNIITSSNIVIKSVRVDEQKDVFFADNPDFRDHYPLIAELYVN